ncbi:MAG: DUF1553 domain-containing protein [Pedosphaera sp.]|nr:DUF1553 domain-containing protein [Pedosphaera sp.]
MIRSPILSRRGFPRTAVFALRLAMAGGMITLAGAAPAGRDSLEGRALAVLEKNCLECHGGKLTRSGFDLSSRESLLRGGESAQTPIVSGQPAESLLFGKVSHTAEPPMPYKRPKLSGADIELLRKWIAAGAPYAQPLLTEKDKVHWSLRPLVKPEPPKVKESKWARTPVDRFVLAKLEEKGLTPSAPADKATLLRRAYFDLTGLPPTPQQQEEFFKDHSPEAFAKVIDELLASPRYGERWARHWLDVVHYADTHGHDQDAIRENAWPYRDYLIQSLNADKPYARFVEEQLAGDILFPESPGAVAALGFIAAGPWDESTLKDIREDTIDRQMGRYIDRDDMVTTTMSTFASTTAQCARCHNHKFDPITQVEYYNLQAVFAGTDRADRTFDPDPKAATLRQTLVAQKALLDGKDRTAIDALITPAIEAELMAWEKSFAGKTIRWTALDPVTFTSANGATLTKQPDHSVLSGGTRPERDTTTITAVAGLTNITAVRVEVLTDDSLPLKGPGRQDNGNLHLTEFRLLTPTNPASPALAEVALQNPSADYDQPGWTISHAVDRDAKTAWGIYPQVGKPHHASLELKRAIASKDGVPLTFVLEQNHGGGHLIGRVRLSVTDAPLPIRLNPVPESIAQIFSVPMAQRTAGQKREVAAHFLRKQIDQRLAALPKKGLVYAGTSEFTPVGTHKPAGKPRAVHVLKRGDIHKPGDPATPGALSCVPGVPAQFEIADLNKEGQRRAALAKWLTHPDNTLVWRSIVNRVWHYHFGRGIVDSPNDFGRMGSAPTHPELLDWLAVTFREGGGSLKQLHRLILNSATWQQSSGHNAKFAQTDSSNAMLWRMNCNRLDAESVHDAVLQITGQLDLTMGGPSVRQFSLSPGIHVTPLIDYGKFDLDSAGGRRRSVYRLIFRTLPDPFMDAMDCADASQLTATRNVSVTALQALAMLNNRFMVRQSEHFAERLGQLGKTPPEQIAAAYQLALGRPPTKGETEALADYAQRHGLANTCRLIFNSNEFIFVN